MGHGDRREAGRLGILHREMPETANADDGDSLLRLRVGQPQAAPDGVAGAEDRGRLLVREPFGDERGGRRLGQHELGMPSLRRDPGDQRLDAEDRLAAQAPLAALAGALDPGDADPIADPAGRHPGAERDDLADRLVSERPGEPGGEHSLGDVHVGVAQSAGLDLHQHLTGAGSGGRDLTNFPGAMQGGDDGDFHHGPPREMKPKTTPKSTGGRMRRRGASPSA